MNLLIIEPHCNGHHASYLYWIIREAINRGYHIQLATLENCLTHSLFLNLKQLSNYSRNQLAIFTANMTSNNNNNTWSLMKREWYYYKLFYHFYHQIVKITTPDQVIIPYLDYCFYSTAFLGSPFKKTPWIGVVMRPAFHFNKMGIMAPHSHFLRIKEQLFIKLLKNSTLKKLWTIDETLKQFIDQTHSSLAKQIDYLPDPAELNGTTTKEQARQILNIKKNAIVILIYGALSLRKGIAELLLATQSPNFPKNVHILLAGNQDKSIIQLLNQPFAQHLHHSGRLHQLNYFLTEEEQYYVFIAADIVWLGYRQHYTMSGVIVQAGQMGLPVIACQEGLLGWLTEQYQLGITVAVQDQEQIITAIKQLTSKIMAHNNYQPSHTRFFASHTPTNFASKLLNSLKLE